MGELLTELLDARWVNHKEIVSLGFAWKTGSENSELRYVDSGDEGPVLDLQYITLDIAEIQSRRVGGRHLNV